uniref:Putative oxalate:formate antiporter n=1 Tax=Schistosoma mansoni TaxID=6183 RepID=A0A3Q0KMF3_SCHMA
MKEKVRNLIFGCISVLGGILIHFSFGFFYSTANIVPYIISYIIVRVDPELSSTASVWISGIALAMQGVSMPFGGLIAKKWGFRIVVAVSCLLDSISIFLTYVTVQRSFPGVIITYSVLQGLGLGFGYSVVLSVAATWFPKRRGLVVGVIVGGFGLGALVFTPIETALINPSNIPVDPKTRHFTHPDILDRVPVAFLILGGILLALQIIGFILLRPKPLESTQDQDTELVVRNRVNSDPNPVASEYAQEEPKLDVCVQPKQLFRHIDFYLLWFVMFCDIIPITIITSAYKLFGAQYIDDDQFLSIVATFSSLFNAGGRVIWGAIVDRLSFKIPMMIMLVIWAIVLLSFPHIGSLTGVGLKVMYAIWVFILFFSLSGVFVIQPAATGILFGPLNMAVNYGIIFTGFTVGSILCSIITNFINTPNAYLVQFTGCGCVCIVALIASVWMEDRKMPKRCKICSCCAVTCKSLRVGYHSSEGVETILDGTS